MQILIENVGNGFCEDPRQFADYVDAIDNPWVGIHFDIGNHIRVSPPAEWIRVLGKRIKKLDAKDRTRSNERNRSAKARRIGLRSEKHCARSATGAGSRRKSPAATEKGSRISWPA